MHSTHIFGHLIACFAMFIYYWSISRENVLNTLKLKRVAFRAWINVKRKGDFNDLYMKRENFIEIMQYQRVISIYYESFSALKIQKFWSIEFILQDMSLYISNEQRKAFIFEVIHKVKMYFWRKVAKKEEVTA